MFDKRIKTTALCIAGILLIGLFIRLIPMSMISSEGVRLIGAPDSFYHMRRARLSMFGTLADFDYWTEFPTGSSIHWPLGYGQLLGSVLRYGGVTALKLFPVVIGLLSICLFWFMARALNNQMAIYTTLLYSIIPVAVFPSVFGAIDHHAVEGFTLIVAMTGFVIGGQRGLLLSVAAVFTAAVSYPAWPLVAVIVPIAYVIKHRSAKIALAGMLLGTVVVPLGGSAYFSIPWLQGVAETRMLILSPTHFFRAVAAISPGLVAVFPALVIWWSRRRERAVAAALAMGLIVLPLTILQARFAPFLAVPAALAMSEVIGWIYRHNLQKTAVFLAVLTLLPPLRGLTEMPYWQPDPAPGLERTMEFLRTQTPMPGDPNLPLQMPKYGVAARWDLGHHIVALAERPVLANPFHTCTEGRARVHTIFFSDPDVSNRVADTNRVRYLLLTELLRSGYVTIYRDEDMVPVPLSLYYRLFVEHDLTLGWHLVYHDRDDSGEEYQVWERTVVKGNGERVAN